MVVALLTLILVLVVALLVATLLKTKPQKNEENNLYFEESLLPESTIPKMLGIRKDANLESLVERLESSLSPEYLKHVKDRVLSEGKLKDSEYDWYLFELKRFFIMTSILKSVPMYSEKVDEIWHQMLMFTKSYQTFCEAFFGEMIHHEPNIGINEGNPDDDRAWFEYVYSQLFEVTPNSGIIYGQFFSKPMSKETLLDIEKNEEKKLLEDFFNAKTYEAKLATKTFINNTKEHVKNVQYKSKPRKRATCNSSRLKEQNQQSDWDYTTQGFLYYSLLSDNESSYQESMKQHDSSLMDRESYSTKSSCSGWSTCSSSNESKSSCSTTTSSCSSSSRSHCSSSSHSSCSSSSRSSCSSSSCSSSSSSCSSSSCSSCSS